MVRQGRSTSYAGVKRQIKHGALNRMTDKKAIEYNKAFYYDIITNQYHSTPLHTFLVLFIADVGKPDHCHISTINKLNEY